MTVFHRDTAAILVRRAQVLAEYKAEAVKKVNTWAGVTRGNYITISPGQEMIYLAKESEAVAFMSNPDTLDMSPFPMISAEIGITAPDAYSMAQLWLNMADLWRSVAAYIEAQRLGAAAVINAAATAEAVDYVLETMGIR